MSIVNPAWIRAGPIDVQDLSPGDICVNYEGNHLNILNCSFRTGQSTPITLNCSFKKLYDIVGGMTDINLKCMRNGRGIFLRRFFIRVNGKNYLVWLFSPQGKPRFSLFILESYIELSLAEIICLRGKLLIHRNACLVELLIIWCYHTSNCKGVSWWN